MYYKESYSSKSTIPAHTGIIGLCDMKGTRQTYYTFRLITDNKSKSAYMSMFYILGQGDTHTHTTHNTHIYDKQSPRSALQGLQVEQIFLLQSMYYKESHSSKSTISAHTIIIDPSDIKGTRQTYHTYPFVTDNNVNLLTPTF